MQRIVALVSFLILSSVSREPSHPLRTKPPFSIIFLKKEKVFGDRRILSTRHLIGKDRGSLGAVFKGPISKIDLWMPGYGFAEIKYAGNHHKDVHGYDLDNRSINNIHSVPGLSDIMKHDVEITLS